jgi:hypothetical protein
MTDANAPPGVTIARDWASTSPPIAHRPDRADQRPSPAVPVDVDEIVGAELEHALARASASPTRSDDMGAGPLSQLHADRSDAAAGAMDHHRLGGLELAVVEQCLPRVSPAWGIAAA